MSTSYNNDNRGKRTILVLHGSRQTGELLLGRMEKLRKFLQKRNTSLEAIDAPFPHPEDESMLQWWNRDKDQYIGLEASVTMVQSVWIPGQHVGLLGFSMGARFAHLLTLLHQEKRDIFLPGLQFTLQVAGYEAPLPPQLDHILGYPLRSTPVLHTPSLFVIGKTDSLIPPASSRSVMKDYSNGRELLHDGGHHVPMRAGMVRDYVDFCEASLAVSSKPGPSESTAMAPTQIKTEEFVAVVEVPDEDALQAQIDEVEALSAIFPDEFHLESTMSDETSYDCPIRYRIDLIGSGEGSWPPLPVAVRVEYPASYPGNDGSEPRLTFVHENNGMQFTSAQRQACLDVMLQAVREEQGNPCVMSCIYAAREFFESGAMGELTTVPSPDAAVDQLTENTSSEKDKPVSMIRQVSQERLQQCNDEGLAIAESLLETASLEQTEQEGLGRGGAWTYTIGLVGKPSAGKSTFFNAATAFARQRDDKETILGGATMAPHPFTTIDPNIGFCLVPAPKGSCPEENYTGELNVGSTHGRDSKGRRLLPVLLKDVAGLVPGAYMGRGRGNKFLSDLTDADVLVHVLDASGTADAEGNAVDDYEGESTNPLKDIEWIHKELIEWVYTNLMFKWETIIRKGRSKLEGMFSGYGQQQAVTWKVLTAVEKFLASVYSRDRALEHLEEWDQGDIHRLVSCFLGVRFRTALALNKADLVSSHLHLITIRDALPTHGALVGVAVSAKEEMLFVRTHILRALESSGARNGQVGASDENGPNGGRARKPEGVWQTLQSALSLNAPVLVFPISSFDTYDPLPGISGTEDPSLPSKGMLTCLREAGGSLPSQWSGDGRYTSSATSAVLRDVLMLKPGSTVEDAFIALKNRNALSGEFVRAEAAGDLGEASRPVRKHQLVGRSNRILKIMTTKRTQWQDKQLQRIS